MSKPGVCSRVAPLSSMLFGCCFAFAQAVPSNAFLFFVVVATALPRLPAATAQDYPSKPVRIITSEPAGINDVATRIIAQGLAGIVPQPVIVENRGGAGGAVAGEIVARATPDGYTLLSYGSSFWLAPFLREKVSYDPISDFAPITLAVGSPVVLAVHPSVPAASAGELIVFAKSRPGALNYGSGGAGSVPHLAMELFKAKAGVNIVRVPYKAAGPAVSDLIAGHVQVILVTAGSVIPHVRSGKLRGLGVGSPKPSPLAPGLPAISDSGLPGYEYWSVWGLFAPAKTPPAIVKRINEATVKFLASAEAKQRLFDAGIEAVGSTPERFAETVKTEMKVLGKLIKDLGIRGE